MSKHLYTFVCLYFLSGVVTAGDCYFKEELTSVVLAKFVIDTLSLANECDSRFGTDYSRLANDAFDRHKSELDDWGSKIEDVADRWGITVGDYMRGISLGSIRESQAVSDSALKGVCAGMPSVLTKFRSSSSNILSVFMPLVLDAENNYISCD